MPVKKQSKVTNEDLLKAINGGFNNVQEQFNGVQQQFNGVQGQFKEVKLEMAAMERRLTNKIDRVQESVKTLEEVDILDLQRRVQRNERDIRAIAR